jgi:hypothetical protein
LVKADWVDVDATEAREVAEDFMAAADEIEALTVGDAS